MTTLPTFSPLIGGRLDDEIIEHKGKRPGSKCGHTIEPDR